MKQKELKRSVELIFARTNPGGYREILMGERGASKHGAGKIAVPGGHCEWLKEAGRWETRQEAAIRETEEEIGSEFAGVVRQAFSTGSVTVVSVVDDIRESTLYDHLVLLFSVGQGIEPDPNATNADEHTDLQWRSVHGITDIGERLYLSQRRQLYSFLIGDHRYVQIDDLQ